MSDQNKHLVQTTDEFISHIQTTAPGLLTDKKVPGIAIALVDDATLKWIGCFGHADIKNCNPVSASTCFQVASISKSITAWGVMTLAQKGLVDIDAPVNNYLKRWNLGSTKYQADLVTVRSLLSHTGGISLHGYLGKSNIKKLCSLEESLQKYVYVQRAPNEAFDYSGGGYSILQLLIEDVTGMSFSSFMKDFLSQMGMHSSTFEYCDLTKENLATPYRKNMRPLPNFLFTEKAAAGLYTTIEDLANFLIINVSNESIGVLDQAVIGKMHTKVRRDIPYGLGYCINILSDGSKLVMHGGQNRGWNSVFALLSGRKSGLAILTNSDNGKKLISELLFLWLSIYCGELTSACKEMLGYKEIGTLKAKFNLAVAILKKDIV